MRKQLIAALDFPRNLVLSLIEERHCPCRKRFAANNGLCADCELSRECHWVTILDDYSDFDGKPTYTINASLRYGVTVVEKLSDDEEHAASTCTCETCTWLRDARRLIAGFERTLPANPFRLAH